MSPIERSILRELEFRLNNLESSLRDQEEYVELAGGDTEKSAAIERSRREKDMLGEAVIKVRRAFLGSDSSDRLDESGMGDPVAGPASNDSG